MTPETLVQTACPKIGSLGAAFYFRPETVAVGKANNLDGFRFYFLGRGGVLGDVEAPVIQSAFGYFNGPLVAKIWNSAKERMAPRDAARLYMSCAQDLGRAKFAGIDGLDAFCAAAEKVLAAIDPAGLTLYAGVAAEPLPEDLPARAMHLVMVLREYRGSAHLMAVLCSGLTAAQAHFLRRPDDMGTFGYTETPTVTDADRAKLVAAEALTDQLVLPAYSVLDENEAAALVAGLEAMEAALA